MLRQLVHSKSDSNFFDNKQIIDDISKNMQRIKQIKRKKEGKPASPFNSGPSTPTSASSFIHNSGITKNARNFFMYAVQILKIKRKFEKDYFRRYVLPSKISNNILIAFIREYAKTQFTLFEVNPQLINDFDQIITIVNSVTPESLFREIKTKILVAFEIVQLKIKNVLQLNKTNSSSVQISFFNSISHIVFFFLSTITYRVDYYSFTMNRLVEKYNKFFDTFLDELSPETSHYFDNDYNHCLRFIQKYIQMKLKFIDEFYQEGSRYTKFNSLGRFLFNNLNEFLGLLEGESFKIKEKTLITRFSDLPSYWIHYKSEIYYIDDSACKLSTYFSMFFNSRLAKWKNDFFHPMLTLGEEREEICRICEQKIKLHHYYLHIYYCLNYVITYQALKKNRKLIKFNLGKVKHLIDNNEGSTEQMNSNLDDFLIQILNESNCSFDSYENDSTQCFKLLSLINEVMINCINNTSGSLKHLPFITRSILQLVSVLMKRFKIVVDILTLKEMRTKNKLSYCDNHYARLSPIIQKNMSRSTRECSDRRARFDNFAFDMIKKKDLFKPTDFSSMKIKQTLNELKAIAKDELTTKTVTKSKFCQSYNNYSENMTQETTIEIYADNQEILNDSPIMAIIPKISDFLMICPIAKGGYGRVDLYKKASTGDIYAIKTVYLDSMQDLSQAELLKNETSISNEIDSEYIVKCYYIFRENSHFYFVSEYMPGRDLLQLLNSIILCYKIILGIEYLHSKGIVHKDIKPENVVISKDGHFKLTDFGISEIYSRRGNKKYIIGNSEGIYKDLFSEVGDEIDENDNDTEGYSNTKKDKKGTLHYMAPEIFIDDQFTSAVDYWALGVVLYELFSLKQPFYGSTTQEIKENILSSDINWSSFDIEDVTSNYSTNELDNAKDLITKLLVKDPLLRYSDKDLAKIKSHPFFNGFNWKEIKSMKDVQVLLHVKKMVEKTNQQIKENKKSKIKMQKHNNQTFPQVLSSTEKKQFVEQTHPFYYSERVDNIFKKCQETMHRIINSNKFKESIDQKENVSFNTSSSSTNLNNSSSMSSTIGSNPFTNFDN